MAASVLTNTPYCYHWTPERFPAISSRSDRPENEKREIWDELVMGKTQKLGWLGKPVGPAIHMAQRETDALEDAGSPPQQALLNRLTAGNADLRLEEGTIKAESPENEIRFQLLDIPCEGSDMTIFITARAATRNGYPSEYARLLIVSANQPGLPYPGPLQHRLDEENRFATFVNEKEFTSFFNFSGLDNETMDLEILVEAGNPIWITGIEAYAHPDAMYREFEHGLVLANPSTDSYTFDLEALFPGQAFRRIEGTENQDPVTNDGSIVKEPVILQGKDALFLIRE